MRASVLLLQPLLFSVNHRKGAMSATIFKCDLIDVDVPWQCCQISLKVLLQRNSILGQASRMTKLQRLHFIPALSC